MPASKLWLSLTFGSGGLVNVWSHTATGETMSVAVPFFAALLLITSGRNVEAQSKPAPHPPNQPDEPQYEQRDQPVTADDLRILEKAQELLKNEAAWTGRS